MIIRTVLLGVISVLTMLSSCTKRNGGAPGGTNAVTIGAALPLSGPIASYGKNSKAGIDMALDEINSAGDIKIRVVYEDDAGLARNAVSAVNKLIFTDRVPLIIGEASSGLSVAVAPLCNQNKVVLFSPVSSAAELTQKGGPYFFRTFPSYAFQGRILARWLTDEKIGAVSLLWVNSSWGTSLKDEFERHYVGAGGKIIVSETCEEGDRDFRSHLLKLARPDIQAIVALTPPKEGGPFVRQAREMGLKVPLFGGDFWGTPEFVESAGEAADGVFFTFPASPRGAVFDDFSRRYNEKYGKDPDIYASYAYDLTHIVANGLRAGAKTGESLRSYLLKMDTYEGVTGPAKFDDNGDVTTKTFDRKTIRNGKYVLVDRQ